MLRKISSVYFRVLVFSALFFAFHSAAYAQASMTFEDINQSYQSRRLTIPKSEIKYQEILKFENHHFDDTKAALRDIYKQEAENIAEAKRGCGTNLRCRKYLSDEGKALVNDYVKAMERLKEIYRRRITQLNAARRNFDSMEMRIDNNLNRQNRSYRIRGYERRIDPSLIQQNRRRYQD